MSKGGLNTPERFEPWLDGELHRQLSTIHPVSPRPAQARYQGVMLRRNGRFRMTKFKVAVAIATGALTLGAAGAYAAQNLPQTIDTPTISTLGATGTTQLNLVSLNNAPKLTALPASALKDPGACVSYFATNRNYALVPQGYTVGSNQPLTISKANYHGKLMSGLNAWCKTQVASSSTANPTATTQSQPSTAPGTKRHGPPPWAHKGGAGNPGHGHHAH